MRCFVLNNFDPIYSFSSHPSLLNRSKDILYFLDNEFYFATNEGLHKIVIRGLDYLNLGEPYREFATIQFYSDTQYDCMNIDFEDAAYLVWFCKSELGKINFEISEKVDSHKIYKRALEKLTKL